VSESPGRRGGPGQVRREAGLGVQVKKVGGKHGTGRETGNSGRCARRVVVAGEQAGQVRGAGRTGFWRGGKRLGRCTASTWGAERDHRGCRGERPVPVPKPRAGKGWRGRPRSELQASRVRTGHVAIATSAVQHPPRPPPRARSGLPPHPPP
jgi:hypothetical protein